MVLFLFGTFLGVELLGFRIDVCFTFLKNLLAFQSACVDLFFQMPGIITHWLMLCARRNKENEQSRLMSAAFLSMERFFKKTLSLWMPLDGSCSGALVWTLAPLNPGWQESEKFPLTEKLKRANVLYRYMCVCIFIYICIYKCIHIYNVYYI